MSDEDHSEENSTSENEEQEETITSNRPSEVMVTVILIFYAGLMMITGYVVYSSYGSGQIEPLITVTGICSVNGICPPSCIIDVCIPQPKPPCIPKVWPSRAVCWNSTDCPTCGLPECLTDAPITETTEPSIQVFRNTFYENHRVVDLINLYPPHSAYRLEVVTTLLGKTIEKFAMWGTFHRCFDSRPYPTTCSFCEDRYEYIRCVMSNKLVDQSHPFDSNKLIPIIWETELHEIIDLLVTTVYKTGHPRNLVISLFERIEKMIKQFSIKTDTGQECKICKDFNRSIYDQCYANEAVKYL